MSNLTTANHNRQLIDSEGRVIDYLRLSITDRCNLRCVYCMPETGIEDKRPHDSQLSVEEMVIICSTLAGLGVKKIRLTGGEPLVYKGLIPLLEQLQSVAGIEELVLTTNGILLEHFAESLKTHGVSRVNVSLDSLQEAKYAQMTRGGNLNQVLKGIEAAIKWGLTPVRVNTVIVPGINEDEVEAFMEWTLYQPIEVRFIELMPIGEAIGLNSLERQGNKKVLDQLEKAIPEEKTDESSPATYFKLRGAVGRVGYIASSEQHFCGNCNRLRITSNGKLKWCLHSEPQGDLKEIIRSGATLSELQDFFIEQVKRKPAVGGNRPLLQNMNQIGG